MSFLPPTTSELKFITDPALRESLQIDISTANSAFSNGEWKASTVLAGSTLEALLLWLLEQETDKKKISAAVKTLVENGKFRGKPSNNHDEWSLHRYIEVAKELKLISDNAATQARLAREFRNFIHPGKSQRLHQRCTRATARSALAAMDHVLQELEARFP
jgi:hypothetical protein